VSIEELATGLSSLGTHTTDLPGMGVGWGSENYLEFILQKHYKQFKVR
jgi:hypothetical protein